MPTVFKCATEKCNNTLAHDQLNTVQLQVIQRSPKKCEDCGKTTVWLEQSSMFSDEVETIKITKRRKYNAKRNNFNH